MTRKQLLAVTSRTYRRASKFEHNILQLADIVSMEGFHKQAKSLKDIAARAMVVADQYVGTLMAKVD